MLSLHPSRCVSACQGFNLGFGYQIVIMLNGMLQAGCRHSIVDSVLLFISMAEGMNQSAAEGISAAYAVYNMSVAEILPRRVIATYSQPKRSDSSFATPI